MDRLERSKIKQDILDALKNSNDVLSDFKNQIKNKNVVIFVGNTRNGKSTLVNYIAGVPLEGIQYDDTFKIKCVDETVAVIGHGTLSFTTIPTVIELPEYPDVLIVDAPGFDDNRSALQELFNALYINQIKHAKGVKFVLVSDIIDILSDNINNFLSFIETVKIIMPDFVQLQNAVSIIFTKVSDEYSREEIIALIDRKILSVNGLYCTTDLIKHFVERPDLMGIFKMPHMAGRITYDLGDNVKGAIFEHEFVNLNKHDIKFGISKAANVVLLDAYLDFFDVGLYVKDVITELSNLIKSNFGCLETNKLFLLGNEELIKLDKFIEYRSSIQDSLNMELIISNIPDVLKKIFIDEAEHINRLLEEIYSELDIVDHSYVISKIETVFHQLEYLTCIEKVLEMDNQSRSILSTCKKCIELFYKDIQSVCNNIEREKAVRKYLNDSITIVPGILPLLEKADEQYLQDSTKNELLAMKEETVQYIKRVEYIMEGIKLRPKLNKDFKDFENVVTQIKRKQGEIEKHLNCNSDFTKYWVSCSLLIPVITEIFYYTKLKFAAVSFAGIIILCYQSPTLRNKLFWFQRRWNQNRLFRPCTVLDGCCRPLLENLD